MGRDGNVMPHDDLSLHTPDPSESEDDLSSVDSSEPMYNRRQSPIKQTIRNPYARSPRQVVAPANTAASLPVPALTSPATRSARTCNARNPTPLAPKVLWKRFMAESQPPRRVIKPKDATGTKPDTDPTIQTTIRPL